MARESNLGRRHRHEVANSASLPESLLIHRLTTAALGRLVGAGFSADKEPLKE